MIDSTYRSIYQKYFIDPLLICPVAKWLSPMKVTAMGLFFGLCVAPLLIFHWDRCAIICLLISGYFDTLDGSLARHQNTHSPLGAVFDIICDRLVELAVLFGLFMAHFETRALPSFLMLGSVLLCVTSFLVVGIFSENQSTKSFHYSPGLIERTEAFAFWIAMILWPQAFFTLSYLFAGLVFLTTAIRISQFAKQALYNSDL